MALLGNLKGSANFFQSSEFYNGVATRSLRLDGSSGTLTRTLVNSSDGSRRKNVWSFWAKFDTLGVSPNPYFYSKGNGGGVADIVYISITSNQRLNFIGYVSDSVTHEIVTTRRFRDPSAWYHFAIAVDTTQSTASNRIQIYVNGVKETAFDTETYPSQNADLAMNWYSTANAGTTVEQINDYYASQHEDYRMNGYLAEYHSVDGLSFFSDTSGTANTAFNINSFVEIKNDICIPVAYTGAHGTQGYHLKFENTSVGSGSSSTVGADSAGTNHWTSNNIVATDCNIADSPENNMCILNPIGRRYGQSYIGTFDEGNLKVQSGGNATHVFGTMAINQIASQGGVYFEVRMDSLDTSRTYFGVVGDNGVNNGNSGSNDASYSFPIKGMIASSLFLLATTHTDGTSVDIRTGNTAYSNGDVAGIAILSDGKFFIHRNGTYLKNASGNVGNPSTGANELATIDLTEGDWIPYVGYSSSFTVNFGQDGSFNGNETSGGNQDANGIGDFMFAVPTNCLAICSSNMAEPTIGPNSATQADSYMDVLNYTGNNTINTDISGLNFKPDLIWTFARGSAATHNTVTDSSRGVHLDVFLTTGAGSSNDTNGILAFNSDGFRLGTSTNHNVNGRTYTTFNWRANGGTTTTNDASATSIGSIDSVIQANTTAGFSIVTYTGDSTGNDGTASTIAHGLGAVPKWIITIPLNVNDGAVYHQQNTTAPETDRLILASTSGGLSTSDDSGFWNDTAPTSTVFSVGTRRHTNSDGGMVAYCWTDIEGFSKFGSFIGNSNNDGPFIYTGFQPAWVMLKNISRSADWRINDTTRQPVNDDGGHLLLANSTSAEITNEYDMDFLSNGFKIKSSDVYENGSNEIIVYMAFAGAPFKYANAR